MLSNYIKNKSPKAILKKLIILFYIYMIVEGMLRKWFIPIFNNEIYFLKDFFLIFIYFYAFKYNFLFEKKISKFFILFIILTLVFGSFGYTFNKIEVLSFLLGSRSYWLFAPIFLVIVHVFNFEDLKKFIKFNLFFIIPYYFLVILQSYYPYDTLLNAGYKSMVQNPERPSAYFTYITQNTYYFLFLLACFFSYAAIQSSINIKKFIFLIFLNFLLMGVLILLKSRASYVFGSVIVIYTSYISLVASDNFSLKFKKLIIILLITPLNFNINSNIYEKEYNFSVERFNSDSFKNISLVRNTGEIKIPFFNFELDVYEFCSKNSSLCRVIDEVYYIPSIKNTSKFGEGIGAGTTIVNYINKRKAFTLGESENHRILAELGYLYGNIFILMKYLIVIFLNFIFFFTNKVTNKLFYFPLLVFVSVSFMIAPITYTTSFISFICWFSFGLLITSFNKHENKTY